MTDLPAFRYFLLDFDGVVAETESVFAEFDCALLNETLGKAGIEPDLTPDYVRGYAGVPAEDKLEKVAALKCFDPAPFMAGFTEKRNALRKDLFRKNPARPANGLEAFLKANRKRAALVTNKRAFKLEPDLLALGLGSSFAAIIACEPPLRKKPEADMIYQAMGILNAKPEETCLIGDTVYDIEAAARAMITPIGFVIEGIENAKTRAEELEKAGAAFVIDSFDDLNVIAEDSRERQTG